MKTKTNKSKPLTITIKGKLADMIRQAAKQHGIMPSSVVAIHLRPGMLATANTEEAKEYRLATAANYVGLSLRATAELHRHAIDLEQMRLAKHRAERAHAERKAKPENAG